MKTSDKDINRLTRNLLKEGMTEPSPDLSRLIMNRIMQKAPLEVPEVKKAKMKSGTPPFMLVGIIIVYLVALGGLLVLFSQQSTGNVSHILESIKNKLPFILMVAAIAGSLIFYSTLDKILALRF